MAQKFIRASNWKALGPPEPKTCEKRAAGCPKDAGSLRLPLCPIRLAVLKRLKTSPKRLRRTRSLRTRNVRLSRRSCVKKLSLKVRRDSDALYLNWINELDETDAAKLCVTIFGSLNHRRTHDSYVPGAGGFTTTAGIFWSRTSWLKAGTSLFMI